MDVLVAYDIADTEGSGRRRLERVAAVCTSYGTRVQLSVFECRVSPERFARMLSELRDAIEPTIDSVLIYQFPARMTDAKISLGRVATRTLGDPWIV